MKNKIFSFVAKLTSVAMILSSLLQVAPVRAATVTSLSDVMTRLAASVASNHEIKFVIPGGIAAGETVTLTFGSGFDISSIVEDDVDFAVGNSNNCSTATFTEEATAAVADAADWGVAVSSQVLTITSGTDTLVADRCVRIRVGTNAVSSGTGANQAVNPTAGANTIVVGGTMGDVGTIALSIVDSDQVTVTATVDPSLTFDLDTATSDTNSASPYSVALGTLTPGTPKSSDQSAINSIYVDLTTNATSGAVVTVRNANGADGLVSTSVPTDTIDSADGTMSSATANYGICIESVTQTAGATLTEVAPYDGTCVAGATDNVVGGLLATATNILTAASPINVGRAEILVNANATALTVAHNDYTDTLTFIATGTF